MMLKEQVFWQTTTYMPSGEELHDLPSVVDIVVVGAGIPGLSAARQFAKRRMSVAVLEAESIGWGASSRNGGMALTGLKVDAAVVEARYGHDLARQMFDDSLASLDNVEKIIQQENIKCAFSRTGHLLLANKPSHFVAMQTEAEWYLKHFNHVNRVIPRDELQSEIDSRVYYGGLVDEISAGLNPAQFVTGLANAAERAGATLHSRARLLQIEKSSAGYRLKTLRGALTAREVLVTTGGYTKSATPQLQKRIIPIGSYIIATAPIPESLARQLLPHNRMVFDYKHFLNYYRFSSDNRMIFGGRAAFFPETASSIRTSAEILQREMVHIFPQLKDVPVEFAWGGTLDFPFDLMPHTGQIDGIYYVLGFAGHGVALGTHLGQKMADAILDGKVAEMPYASYPFPTAPLGLYNGNPWFLPLIGLQHRILDILY
ncbi:MAG TPA: FAD-binding oxidoreductase [Anaerolineales bacterium]|nr:FAD-binding oxidoreductase [Anaerolineales bacterium]